MKWATQATLVTLALWSLAWTGAATVAFQAGLVLLFVLFARKTAAEMILLSFVSFCDPVPSSITTRREPSAGSWCRRDPTHVSDDPNEEPTTAVG